MITIKWANPRAGRDRGEMFVNAGIHPLVCCARVLWCCERCPPVFHRKPGSMGFPRRCFFCLQVNKKIKKRPCIRTSPYMANPRKRKRNNALEAESEPQVPIEVFFGIFFLFRSNVCTTPALRGSRPPRESRIKSIPYNAPTTFSACTCCYTLDSHHLCGLAKSCGRPAPPGQSTKKKKICQV